MLVSLLLPLGVNVKSESMVSAQRERKTAGKGGICVAQSHSLVFCVKQPINLLWHKVVSLFPLWCESVEVLE